jgi:hypothetical protein
MCVDHCAGDRAGARVVVELEHSDLVRGATAAANDRSLQVHERERYEGTMRVCVASTMRMDSSLCNTGGGWQRSCYLDQ